MLGTWTIFLSNILPAMEAGLATKYTEIGQCGSQTKGFTPTKPLPSAWAPATTNARRHAGRHAAVIGTVALGGIITGAHFYAGRFGWCGSVLLAWKHAGCGRARREACARIWVTLVGCFGRKLWRLWVWFKDGITVVERRSWKIDKRKHN